MADLIGTEKDAKDISGANVVVEDKKCVTKARALAIGAEVTNAASYLDNLLVCKKDLQPGWNFGWSILNPTVLYNYTVQLYTPITKNFFLSEAGTPFGKETFETSLFTIAKDAYVNNKYYYIARSYTTMIPNDPKVATSKYCSWAVVGASSSTSSSTTSLKVYVNSGTNTFSNMVERFTITSPNSSCSYISLQRYILYAVGSCLTVLFTASNNDNTQCKWYFAKMDRLLNNSTVTYVDISKNWIKTGTSTITNFNPYSIGISNPNKHGIAIAQTMTNYSSSSTATNTQALGMLVRLLDFNKLIATNWVVTTVDSGSSLPFTLANLFDWIDDGTLYGSWIVVGVGFASGTSSHTPAGAAKITNLQCTSNGNFTVTNLRSNLITATSGGCVNYGGLTYCRRNKVYYILGYWGTDNKNWIYKADSSLSNPTKLVEYLKVITDVIKDTYDTINSWRIQVTEDGNYLIVHSHLWFLLFDTNGNLKSSRKRSYANDTSGGNTSKAAWAYAGNFIMPHQLGPGATTMDYDFVDLGLPSGTLWARTNVGATLEYQVGNTYAFSVIGETPSSTNVYNGLHNSWGGNWKIPTKELWAELAANTNASKVTLGGYTCLKCTSKTNSNYILLPLNISSSRYYAYYPAQDTPDGGWYVQVWDTHINANSGSAFGGTVLSPVRGVLLPSKIDYN